MQVANERRLKPALELFVGAVRVVGEGEGYRVVLPLRRISSRINVSEADEEGMAWLGIEI